MQLNYAITKYNASFKKISVITKSRELNKTGVATIATYVGVASVAAPDSYYGL